MSSTVPSHYVETGKNITNDFQLVTIFQVLNFTETANPLKLKIEVKAFSPCLLASRPTIN